MRTRRIVALAVGIASLATVSTAFSAVLAAPGSITTVAGIGSPGHTGDGGPATKARISHPRGIAVMPDGGFEFAEPYNNDVRRVWPDGTITTVAGSGVRGDSGDGGPATQAEFSFVHAVSARPDGAVLIADERNSRVRLLSTDGIVTTVAGTGVSGFSGDGGPATAAMITNVRGVVALPDGGFLIPDTDNHRVRRVWPNGTITTVAGTGVPGFSGDGGPATAAQLNQPFGVAPIVGGGFLIADAGNHRVRRVSSNGTITTVAGTGVDGFSGDGGDAVDAEMSPPINVAVMPDGGFVIADTANHRVRRVWPDGTITTIAGTGVPGYSGEGAQAATAELREPKALAVTPSGALLVGDSSNDRVRLVEPVRAKAPAIVSARFMRAGHLTHVAFRACDSTRASLVAEFRQMGGGGHWTLVRRPLSSTRGGCRPFGLAFRTPSTSGGVVARLRVRNRAGLESNVVSSRN